jgi:DNA-binding Lrp family transcriptional regulator
MLIRFRDEELEVDYNSIGDYIPSSCTSIGEYPEIEIDAIYFGDCNIMPILRIEDIEEIKEIIIYQLYE